MIIKKIKVKKSRITLETIDKKLDQIHFRFGVIDKN